MDSMRLERPIVVGVDEKQTAALRYALDEAEAQGCGVRVVHVYSLTNLGPTMLSAASVDAAAVGAYEILEIAQNYVESQDTDVPVEYEAVFGAPTQVLEAEAKTARALVLGPENASWYERILAGEVGAWLATRAECPVIIVPEQWFAHSAGRGGVVVSVDGATAAHGPLTFAFKAADRRNEDLHALHVVPPATSLADEADYRLNVAEVLSGWADEYPDVKIHQSVVFGQPDEACIGATNLANLVVVGRPHGRGMPFSLVRPVAVAVIKEANCPVAVVPANFDGK